MQENQKSHNINSEDTSDQTIIKSTRMTTMLDQVYLKKIVLVSCDVATLLA